MLQKEYVGPFCTSPGQTEGRRSEREKLKSKLTLTAQAAQVQEKGPPSLCPSTHKCSHLLLWVLESQPDYQRGGITLFRPG